MSGKTNAGLMAIIIIILVAIFFPGCIDDETSQPVPETNISVYKELNISNVTTKWDLTFLFCCREDAFDEFEEIKQRSQEIEFRSKELRLRTEYINETYRQKFKILTGTVLLENIEDEMDFLQSLDILYMYALAQYKLNSNDETLNIFLSDINDLYTEYETATSFVTVKLTSISKDEWDKIFIEEPGLEKYRPYLEYRYIRYADHRPQNESHCAYIAGIVNQQIKVEMIILNKITNTITRSGNITLDNGKEYAVNFQSYESLLSTDVNRDNREKCYDRMFYHLINESDKMAGLYYKKAKLDDLYAKEKNFTDCYEAKLYCSYLTREQIEDMNSVFKQRKNVFDGYYEFRMKKLGLDQLRPYDLHIQLMEEPDKKYNYTDALIEIQGSYSRMDPVFNDIFIETVTGNFTDVYPDPENGKHPGCFCIPIITSQSPSLMFMNYQGLIRDKKTITHEFGHVVNFYLMSNTVDYMYRRGPRYEIEIPSTFNEELYVDYVIENSDQDIAVAVLAQHIQEYHDYCTYPLMAEFEYEAHKLCQKKDYISGADLNSLWTDISKDYRNDLITYYDEDSAEWTYIRHMYLTDNYNSIDFAISKAITLSLFKKYIEDPDEFNKNYIEYLSVGSTITPAEKLKKYFNIEVNKTLFEDAMDIMELRVDELNELENRSNSG